MSKNTKFIDTIEISIYHLLIRNITSSVTDLAVKFYKTDLLIHTDMWLPDNR